MHALLAEENNLADCLHAAVAIPDPWITAQLMAALAAFWTVKGDNARVIALAAAVDEALQGWEPAPEQVEVAVTAAVMTAMNTVVGEIMESQACMSLLERYGDKVTGARVRGLVQVLLAMDGKDVDGTIARLGVIAAGPDR